MYYLQHVGQTYLYFLLGAYYITSHICTKAELTKAVVGCLQKQNILNYHCLDVK